MSIGYFGGTSDSIDRYTLPNGQHLALRPAYPPVFSEDLFLQYGTFEELIAAISGEWIFSTASVFTPTAAELYRFTVLPFEENQITIERPIILQPSSGSIVQSPFIVEWDPAAFTDWFFGFYHVNAIQTALEPGKFRVTFEQSYFSGPQIRFAASATQDLSLFVTSIIPPASNPTFDLSFELTYVKSTSIIVYPAPEPANSVTAIIGILAIMVGKLRKK